MAKPGRKSTVETHPDFLIIRQKLANGISTPKLSEQTGISVDSLCRYRKQMTEAEIARLRYSRFRESEAELAEIRDIEAERCVTRNATMMAEIFHCYRLAVDSGDFRGAATLANSYHKFQKLQSELVGELVRGNQTINFNVTESEPYRRLVSLLITWAGDKPSLQIELSKFLEAHEREFDPVKQLEAKPNGDGAFIPA